MFAKLQTDGWHGCAACHSPIHDWIIRFDGDKYHRRCVPTNGNQSGVTTKVLIGHMTPRISPRDTVLHRGEQWIVREVKPIGGQNGNPS